MPTASSLAWKTSLRKVRTLWHCSRLRRGALPMIDRGDIRQAIDRCSNIWASLPGAGYVSSSIRLTAWLQNSKKRAERSEIDYGQSHRDYLRSLSASSSACHGLLIITVITPSTTKPSATKYQRTEAGERGNYWHADASAWCCCARCKIHEELADAKAENDALRDDVAAGRRRLHIKAVCQSVREATTASGVDNAASPDWQTPLNGIISPSKQNHYAKTTGRSRSILMSSADKLPISMGNSCNYCEQYTRASAEV